MKYDFEELFLYRIALTLVDGVGDILARQLVNHCGDAAAVFKEKKRVLEKIPDIGPKTAAAVCGFRDFDRAGKELDFVRKHRIQLLYYLDKEYPARLKNCYDSPTLLYYKGTAEMNHKRVVAIVGTRNSTEYGRSFTRGLVDELAQMECMVVSGLAYGIDITAHKASLASGVNTVGVLAHGLDRIYPQSHKAIAAKMIEQGGLITEHIHGEEPDKENFPKRNRIIAGLSDAIIVVEAAKKGGALITADIANSYNRDVFALPGRIDDPVSEGCNTLIKANKAALIQSASDIRYIMGWDEADKPKSPIQHQLFVELNDDEKRLMQIIQNSARATIDTIVIESAMNPSKVAALLLNMEFSGVIRSLPGKIYEAH